MPSGGQVPGFRVRWKGCLHALALATVCADLHAQRAAMPEALPDSPGFALQQAAPPAAAATLSGTVLDRDGAAIPGALVTLELMPGHVTLSTRTGSDGVFTFTELPAGSYSVTVAAEGFASWSAHDLHTQPGETNLLPAITLGIAPLNSTVEAVFSPHEMAEEQVKMEEKQRVLGIVPNFFAVYVWHAAPLTPRQKFHLAFRVEIDPFTFAGSGIVAGIEQATNSFPGYGPGAAGFAKRYGASYADGFTGTLIGGAILPSLLHQDPRYFYKGTGSISSRALYAISTVAICRGDNGRWQPNYSSVLGDLSAAALSNLYYPASDRHGAGITIANSLIGTASGALGSLIQEFFLRRITPDLPPAQSVP